MRGGDDALGNLAWLADINQDHVLQEEEERETKSVESLCDHTVFNAPSIAQLDQKWGNQARRDAVPCLSCG